MTLLLGCLSVSIPLDRDDAAVEAIGTSNLGFEPERGLWDAPFELTLRAPSGADVRFTLDGTDPRADGASTYSGPLAIDGTTVVRAVLEIDGDIVGAPSTHTYLFPADVPTQDAPGYPTSWWTWYVQGGYPADYGMDPEVYQDPRYEQDFPASLAALPTLSLVMDPEDLFGRAGIYERPEEDGWERPVSVEWIDGIDDLQIDAGIRIHGNASRDPANSPKKSFRLAFRSDYGEPSLEYALFPDSDVTDFDGLILRAGYNTSWIHWSTTQREQAQYRRDGLARRLHAEMGAPSTHQRVAHLYLDGLYWGVYVVHERPDAGFMARTFGGDEDDWDVVNTGAAIDGDMDAWNRMMTAVERGLADDDDYAAFGEWIDSRAFADYYLLNLYLGNTDWPGNNWMAGRRREADQRWTFFMWDAEHILEDVGANQVDADSDGSPGRIFQALRRNEEFRVLFGDRARRFLFHDGALTADAVGRVWQDLGAVVRPALVAESARWGDYRRDVNPYAEAPYELYTVHDHWVPEAARIRDSWLPQRGPLLLGHLRAAGLYPAIDAPEPEPWCGEVDAGQVVEIASSFAVFYTLDGTDPRSAGGEVAGTANAWTGGITLDADTRLMARAWSDAEGWSALTDCGYTVR